MFLLIKSKIGFACFLLCRGDSRIARYNQAWKAATIPLSLEAKL